MILNKDGSIEGTLEELIEYTRLKEQEKQKIHINPFNPTIKDDLKEDKNLPYIYKGDSGSVNPGSITPVPKDYFKKLTKLSEYTTPDLVTELNKRTGVKIRHLGKGEKTTVYGGPTRVVIIDG